jgi:hypothetical protein
MYSIRQAPWKASVPSPAPALFRLCGCCCCCSKGDYSLNIIRSSSSLPLPIPNSPASLHISFCSNAHGLDQLSLRRLRRLPELEAKPGHLLHRRGILPPYLVPSPPRCIQPRISGDARFPGFVLLSSSAICGQHTHVVWWLFCYIVSDDISGLILPRRFPPLDIFSFEQATLDHIYTL